MAKSGEHRMLFDLRGRRKRVIQVAYAGLALVMALSLFTVVGPVNIGDLFGGSSGTTNTSSVFDDQVQRLERQLKKNPSDPTLLTQLTRTSFNAGNAGIQRDPNSGQLISIPQSAIDDFNKAGDAWQRYLKTNPSKPDANAAQLAAQALLYSAATSTAIDFPPNIKAAAAAQAVFADAKPSLNAYVTLAQYRFFAGDVAGGEQAGRKAEQEAPKSQRPAVKQAVAQYKAQGAQIQKKVKSSSKFNPNGGGKQALENPLGGLSGGGSGAGATAP
jgi:hypothetical protein